MCWGTWLVPQKCCKSKSNWPKLINFLHNCESVSLTSVVGSKKKSKSKSDTADTVGSPTKRNSELKFPQLEKLLVNYFRECENWGQFFTGDQIKEKWYEFSELKKRPSKDWLKLSGGWLDAFKARHNLCEIKKHGKAASASPEAVAVERNQMCKNTAEYKQCDFYLIIQFSIPPDSGLASQSTPGVKGSKARITVVCTKNSNGLDSVFLTFISQLKSPFCFNEKTPPHIRIDHYHNSTSWTTSILLEW